MKIVLKKIISMVFTTVMLFSSNTMVFADSNLKDTVELDFSNVQKQSKVIYLENDEVVEIGIEPIKINDVSVEGTIARELPWSDKELPNGNSTWKIYVTHVNYKMSYYIDVKKTSTDATIVNSYGEQADAWLVASDVTYGIDTRLPKKVSMKLYFRDLSGSRTVRLNSNIINSGKTLNVQWIR